MIENRVSDGPISGFKGGWARIPFAGEICHRWEEVEAPDWMPVISSGGRIRTWRSVCGRAYGRTNRRVQALGVGSLRTCRLCAAAEKRHSL